VALLQSDRAHALVSYEEALQLCRGIGDRAGAAECLEGLAAVAAQQDRPEHAAWLCGAAAGLREAAGIPLPPTDRAAYAHLMVTARAALGEDAFAAVWAAGRALPLEQALAAALAPPGTRA